MTVLALRFQRGVGCTHVENPPFEIRYLRGPIFSMVSPKKYTTVSWFATGGGGAMAPGRGGGGLCGFTIAMPVALKNVPRRVSVLNSTRSAEMRLSPCEKTTFPFAMKRVPSE